MVCNCINSNENVNFKETQSLPFQIYMQFLLS